VTIPRRIDAHQHFWRYSPATHPWIDQSMTALMRDFLPPDLAPLLGAAGFRGSIAVQARQDVRETEWLLALADAHPFILGVVGWVDLCADDAHEQLARMAAHPKLRGVRHVVQDEPDPRFMLRPEFMRGIGALKEFGLAYDILVYARQLPAAIELVGAFPAQRFVIDHAAKPDIRGREFAVWSHDIREIASAPNVYCKLSGLVTEGDWRDWAAADFAPYIDTVLDAFRPQRSMIGSDWPVCTLAGTYQSIVAIVTDRIARLSAEDQDEVLGGTAARFYKV
jgi:L-fuconolactonase